MKNSFLTNQLATQHVTQHVKQLAKPFTDFYKTKKLNLLVSLCLSVYFSFCLSHSVFAFPPGTAVDSMATVNFTINGSDLVLESSPTGNTITGIGNGSQTRMAVDRALTFTIVSNDTAGSVNSANAISVLAGQDNIVASFTLTNTGNATQDFILSAVNSDVAGETNIDIPSSGIDVFVEDGTTAAYQNLQDTQQFINDLAPEASQTIYVLNDIPASATVSEFITITLVAQVAEITYSDDTNNVSTVILADESNRLSNEGVFETITITGGDIPAPSTTLDTPCNAANDDSAPCDFQTIFAEPAAASVEDINSSGVKGTSDVSFNGQVSDSVGLVLIQSPILVSKSQTVLAAEGAQSGGTIRYNLQINILCTTSPITDVIITDSIPALTEFVSGSILFNGSAPANTNILTVGGIAFDAPNNRIVANLGTQAAQASCSSSSDIVLTHNLSFDVLID